jgi:hypothetical protein
VPATTEIPAPAATDEMSETHAGDATPPSAGAAASGDADRFATFKPAHPDLNAPIGVLAPEPKPHDLLAAPALKSGAPSAAPNKPRTIEGPGDVTANVAEDGTIGFDTPAPIRPNKLPLYTFRDGQDDGSGPPPDPDGILKRRSPFSAAGEGVRVGLSGRMDVTELLMKLAGQDPHISAKQALAEQTSEKRQCMAKRVHGENLKEALFTLSSHVRQVVTRSDLSLAMRRQIVFELWDECSEESDGIDYGAMARATVVSIVREAFPAGSDKAYSPSELLAFNERRSSRQRFDPYNPNPMLRRSNQPDGGLPQ